ncbi:MAG: YgcG family protein [Candidatus Competibacteraceae bacterium]
MKLAPGTRVRLLLLLLLAGAGAWADVAVPPLTARVTDLAGLLTPAQRTALESRLQAFEAAKGSQIAVLIVPTTRPETVEQYALRVAEAWKLGRKGVDDGALLLVAKDDRTLRIEVGYGLEGVLNDATAKRITNEIIVPAFKQGRFYEGIDAGVERMIRVIEGEPLPPPTKAESQGESQSDLFPLVIFGLFLVLILLSNLSSRTGRWSNRGRYYGGGFGGGYYGGGFGGGGFGGGGGSGGGFSGGGGGFGGGGASDRW